MSSLRYQALGPLLSGEGSRAFLGLEVTPDDRAYPVVLVWLPEAAEKDPALLEKIRRETEHAAKLEHPNIVRVHGFTKLDEGHARVVDFADGESLRKVIERAKQLPPAIAAKIICDAATGVHFAHLAGNDDGTPLIHGDLRPETMLLSFDGHVMVTGYGALAFAPREHGGQRVKGRRVHTAPEQIIGGRDSYSVATDVYLLGVALYECLTGAVPFADQADFFDHAVLTLPLPPMPPGVAPEALEHVITKACAKKMPERYQSALAFKEAVEAAIGALPSNDELAAYLKPLFPESDESRAARRQAINDGIAEFARRQWAKKAETPAATTVAPPVSQTAPPSPAPAPAAVTPAVAAKPVAAPKPLAALVAGPRPSVPMAEPAAAGGRGRLGLGLVLSVAALAFLVWWVQRPSEPLPSIKRFEASLDAGQAKATANAPEPVDAAVSSPAVAASDTDAGAQDAAVAATAEDDSMLAALPVPDAGKAWAGPPPKTVLKLNITPAVEVTLDGKILGKTPLTIDLPPGKVQLSYENKNLGIKGSRTITLKPGPNTEDIAIGLGTVILTAPPGAAVFMDGKRIGTAPMNEIKVYEGFHRILVTVGKAKWVESFAITAGDNVRYNVEFE